jgi:hypothetical protein
MILSENQSFFTGVDYVGNKDLSCQFGALLMTSSTYNILRKGKLKNEK